MKSSTKPYIYSNTTIFDIYFNYMVPVMYMLGYFRVISNRDLNDFECSFSCQNLALKGLAHASLYADVKLGYQAMPANCSQTSNTKASPQ